MLFQSFFVSLCCVLQLSRALDLYLSPSRDLRGNEDASAVLSHHLGLEIFEPLREASQADYFASPFIGQGVNSALLVVLEDEDAEVLLPDSLKPSLSLSSSFSYSSFLVSDYIEKSKHVFSSVFPHSTAWTYEEVWSFLDTNPERAFAGLHLSSLAEIRRDFGSDSHAYREAAATASSFLYGVLEKGDDIRLAVLTHPTAPSLSKRQTSPLQPQAPFPNRPLPQEPIGAISTCFATVDACNNGTSTCSGRGQCLKATKGPHSCFVCACGATKTGKGDKTLTKTWAGESCEREDISSTFVLLAGTAVALILLTFGSISLLYSVGNAELPSTLLAGAVNAKRD